MRAELALDGEAATLECGRRLAKVLRGGELVCLSGPLGAGKTTFVRGVLRALGHAGVVRSPTFALIHEYRSVSPKVYHLDLYRLRPSELAQLPLRECLDDGSAACLIEWPEAARDVLPRERLELKLALRGRGRFLRARAFGAKARRGLRALSARPARSEG